MNCSKLTDVLIVNWLPILLQVVIFGNQSFHFNYVADFPCCNELHRYMLLLFVFPNLSKNFFFRHLRRPNLLMLWSWTIYPRPVPLHLYCYYFKNFPLLFCYPFLSNGVQRYRLLSELQNCFWKYFFTPLFSLPKHPLSKELFPSTIAQDNHPVFLFGSAKIEMICRLPNWFWNISIFFAKLPICHHMGRACKDTPMAGICKFTCLSKMGQMVNGRHYLALLQAPNIGFHRGNRNMDSSP